MKKNAPTNIHEYWELAIRRKWWIIVPTLVITLAVCVVAYKLPKIYKSETLILVDPQKVPPELIRSTVSGGVAERLQTISQEILSRTRLQRIIDQFGLYREYRAKLSDDDIIEKMRKDIQVQVDLERRSEAAIGAFKISYVGRDPVLVQQVTNEIASLFIMENLKAREQQAESTAEFIDRELEKAREALQEQEEKIRLFKLSHMGSLPEQQQTNLSLLSQYQGMLQTNSEAIARNQQQKTYLESLIQASDKNSNSGNAAVAVPTPLQTELSAKKLELLAAKQKYKDSHPDVIRLQTSVRILEQQVKEAQTQNIVVGSPSDPYLQIRQQIVALQQEQETRARRQLEIESKMRQIQGRVELLPTVEQQFAEINRDYQTSKQNYESLLQKKNASSIAAELERHAKGEQFRILDPASFPEKPYRPNVPLVDAIGFLAGLAIGIGLAMFIDLNDTAIYTEKELVFYTSLPVMGTFPVLVTSDDTSKT